MGGRFRHQSEHEEKSSPEKRESSSKAANSGAFSSRKMTRKQA
jgi:hypothetical protein